MPISIKSGFIFAPRPPAVVGPSIVQSKTTQNGSGSTTTMNLGLTNPVTSGDMLVVTVGCAGATAGDTATFTDDKGNTYTSALAFVINSSTVYGIATGYKSNITNSPQTITVTLNNARTFLTMIADEWAHAGALDVAGVGNAQNSPPTTTDAVTSTAITTVTNGDLIYGIGVSTDSLGLIPGTGFTGIQSVVGTFYTEYLIQGTAGSIPATFTAAATGSHTITSVLSFLAV